MATAAAPSDGGARRPPSAASTRNTSASQQVGRRLPAGARPLSERDRLRRGERQRAGGPVTPGRGGKAARSIAGRRGAGNPCESPTAPPRTRRGRRRQADARAARARAGRAGRRVARDPGGRVAGVRREVGGSEHRVRQARSPIDLNAVDRAEQLLPALDGVVRIRASGASWPTASPPGSTTPDGSGDLRRRVEQRRHAAARSRVSERDLRRNRRLDPFRQRLSDRRAQLRSRKPPRRSASRC